MPVLFYTLYDQGQIFRLVYSSCFGCLYAPDSLHHRSCDSGLRARNHDGVNDNHAPLHPILHNLTLHTQNY